ncbi:MAG: helix-turn-helix transcriptional regulator [Candidatus Cohnella colombiensis]|uniref:Helix-turn-helix transcriptional regulator n=1 Tax=Candidatus Cohnella colombiensis TaxID=3121368 RepID=A0AA95J9E8_9BACL|nr:MAG: helix-turn-helix transcriptional regulator [Cohnella sp.]
MRVTEMKYRSQSYPNRRLELYLHGMHSATVGKGQLCERHLHHRMLELNLVLKGSQTAIIDSKKLEQCAGEVVIIPPMRLHEFIVEHSEETKYFVIHIQNVGHQLLHHLYKSEVYLYPNGSSLHNKIQPVLHRLLALLQNDCSDNRIIHTCSELLIQLEDEFIPEVIEDTKPEVHHLAEQIAREIEQLLFAMEQTEEGNLHSNWLETISQRLGISRRHCHRIFQQTYNMSPRQYFSIVRQQEAMHMLLGSSETLEKIAYRIGFENVQSFIRQFTKWTGITPGVFRKREVNNRNYLTPIELSND